MSRTYTVNAIWDDEAKVWISQSDIEGLHIEADTLEEFEAILANTGAELVAANHVSDDDLGKFSSRDLIPAIIFVRPQPKAA